MPVGVAGSNRDDRRLRPRSGDPAGAGAVRAPVMRELEHIDARDCGRGEPASQLFLLRVTGEQGTKLPVLNEDANGRVILRASCVVRGDPAGSAGGAITCSRAAPSVIVLFVAVRYCAPLARTALMVWR